MGIHSLPNTDAMNDNGTECIAKCFDSGDRNDGTNIVRSVAKTMDRQKSREEKKKKM